VKPRGRLADVCGLLAPASFIGAWAACGSVRDDYDPVDSAISQLARIGSPTRLGMSAGFVAFGVLLPVFGTRLPSLVGAGRSLRTAVTVAGLATVAVAALPLQREEGGTRDTLHAVAAGVGYAAMALSPALAARALARSAGRRPAAVAAGAVSAVSVAALVLSVTTGPTGLWQRLGLGVVDVWFAGWALRSLAVSDGTVRAEPTRVGQRRAP
jgi:hypothetical protein